LHPEPRLATPGLRLASADSHCARRCLRRADAKPDGAGTPTAAGWAAGRLAIGEGRRVDQEQL